MAVQQEWWPRAMDAQGTRLPTPTEWASAEAVARVVTEAALAEERARREAAEADTTRLREERRRLREGQG